MCALVVGLIVGSRTFPTTNPLKFQRTRKLDAEIVVIGGGPAGAVVAGKVGGGKVVLIEAAGEGSQRVLGGRDWLFRDRTIFDVPFAWSYVAQTKKYLWDVPAGFLAKALGGCGVHNAMLYVRALPSDLERWNATSWNWNLLRERYLQVEDWQGDADGAVDQGWADAEKPGYDPTYHSVGGPLAVSGGIYRDLLARKFLETLANPAHSLGLMRTPDFNIQRRGAGYYHFNIRDGLRESAAAAFLGGTIEGYAPVPHLSIRRGITVTKLIFKKRRVVALKVSSHAGDLWNSSSSSSAVWKIQKNAKVVLTAGAVLTPYLLQKSGVGPGGIVLDEPGIGRGLQDHPAVGVVFDVRGPLTADMAGLYGQFMNWTHGEPFGSYSRAFGYPGFSAGAFFDSGLTTTSDDPDLQLTVFPVQIEPHLASHSARLRLDQAVVTIAVVKPETKYTVRPGPNDEKPHFQIDEGSQQPESATTNGRGGLHPRDAQRLAAGVRRVRQIFALSPLNDYVRGEHKPGPEIQSDSQLLDWIFSSYTQNSHWCCSVNFGKDGPLDPETLKVKGLENLFVADSSAFPEIPNGNVHSTVVAVAAEFADRLAALQEQERR